MTPGPDERISRLTLGTVQLGMDYGIVVPTSPPPKDVVHTILDQAATGGITCFDTAPAYGTAESTIGDWLALGARTGRAQEPYIVTKLSELEECVDAQLADDIGRRVHHSQSQLRSPTLNGYLVHRASDLHRTGVADRLRALVEMNEIEAFGVSVYDPEDLETAIEVWGLSLVQLPFSVFDRRMAESGLIERCANRGITVFARSVFLQGVVFQDPSTLPGHFDRLRPGLTDLGELARRCGVSIAALCLQFVMNEPGIASTVIGAARPDQLAQNLAAAEEPVPQEVLDEARRLAVGLDASILDPRRWP